MSLTRRTRDLRIIAKNTRDVLIIGNDPEPYIAVKPFPSTLFSKQHYRLGSDNTTLFETTALGLGASAVEPTELLEKIPPTAATLVIRPVNGLSAPVEIIVDGAKKTLEPVEDPRLYTYYTDGVPGERLIAETLAELTGPEAVELSRATEPSAIIAGDEMYKTVCGTLLVERKLGFKTTGSYKVFRLDPVTETILGLLRVARLKKWRHWLYLWDAYFGVEWEEPKPDALPLGDQIGLVPHVETCAAATAHQEGYCNRVRIRGFEIPLLVIREACRSLSPVRVHHGGFSTRTITARWLR